MIPESDNSSNNEGDPILIESDEASETTTPEVDDVLAAIGSGQYNDIRWAAACEFFGVPLDTSEILLEGTLQVLSAYQMYAVWWLLSDADRGTNGGILADEMGLGKTRTALAMLQVRKLLLSNCAAVLDEWEAKLPPDQRQHNPRIFADGNPRRRCPASQAQPNDDICRLPCYCLGKATTDRIADLLYSGYAVITSEASIIGQWESQATNYIDPNADNPLHFLFGPSAAGLQNAMSRCTATVVDGKWTTGKGKLTYDYAVKVPINTNHYVFVVSHSGLKSLSDKFQTAVQRTHQKERKTFHLRRFVPAMFIVDEAHKYKGDSRHLTIPFKELQHVRVKSDVCPILVALTGTPITNKLMDICNIVEHMCDVTPDEYRQKYVAKNGVQYPLSLDRLRYLETQLTRIRNAAQAVSAEECKKVRIDIVVLLSSIMIKRDKQDEFRGRRLTSLPRKQTFDVDCRPSPDTQQAVDSLKTQIQSFCRRELQKAVETWRKSPDPKKGLKPTASSYYENAVRKYKRMVTVYHALLHSSVFPTFASLYTKEKFPNGSLMPQDRLMELFSFAEVSKEANAISVQIANGAEREQVTKLIQESPYWELATYFLQDAPKINQLCTIIEDIASIEEPHPSDESPAHHTTVFAMVPAAALVIFMILYIRCPIVDVRLLHRAFDPSNSRSRNALFSWFQETCGPRSRPKVIVLTYQLDGNEIDLQRGNYCVLVGRDFNTANVEQAQSRTHRMGQLLDCSTYVLEDSTHPIDQAMKRKMESLWSLLGEAEEQA